MRAPTLVRATLVTMFIASIGVAGTTVVMNTASTFFAQADLFTVPDDADGFLQPVQAGELERQLRSYQVRLAADGSFGGRINLLDPVTGAVTAARNITIALLQDGRVMYEVRPGSDGLFQIDSVAPGTYSVVGAGPEGYVAYALQVLPAELTVGIPAGRGVEPVAFQEVQEQLAIDSVAVPISDLPTVLSVVENNIPPELLQPNPSGTGVTPAEPITERYDAEALARRDVALAGQRVRIQADGTLEGRVHRINQAGEPTRIRRLNVFLVQNNQVVSQAPVDELGNFSFFDVDDGVYSFVAAGVEGLAAFTMQAVSSPDLAGVSSELILPVSATIGQKGSGAAGVVGGENLGQAHIRGWNAVNGGRRGAAGGSGGGGATGPGTAGGTAGGGGFSGGSGFGGLLAAGLAAGLGIFAATQDDGGQNGGGQEMVSPMDTGGQNGGGQSGGGQTGGGQSQ